MLPKPAPGWIHDPRVAPLRDRRRRCRLWPRRGPDLLHGASTRTGPERLRRARRRSRSSASSSRSASPSATRRRRSRSRPPSSLRSSSRTGLAAAIAAQLVGSLLSRTPPAQGVVEGRVQLGQYSLGLGIAGARCSCSTGSVRRDDVVHARASSARILSWSGMTFFVVNSTLVCDPDRDDDGCAGGRLSVAGLRFHASTALVLTSLVADRHRARCRSAGPRAAAAVADRRGAQERADLDRQGLSG